MPLSAPSPTLSTHLLTSQLAEPKHPSQFLARALLGLSAPPSMPISSPSHSRQLRMQPQKVRVLTFLEKVKGTAGVQTRPLRVSVVAPGLSHCLPAQLSLGRESFSLATWLPLNSCPAPQSCPHTELPAALPSCPVRPSLFQCQACVRDATGSSPRAGPHLCFF